MLIKYASQPHDLPFVAADLKLGSGHSLVQGSPVLDVPLEGLAGTLFQVGHGRDQLLSHPFNYHNGGQKWREKSRDG